MINPTVYKYLLDATSELTQPRVFIDLGRGNAPMVSSSLILLENARESVNENATEYTLYPYELNDPPIITRSILDASNPRIRNNTSWAIGKKAMYVNDRGAITAAAGSKIELRIGATQPDILNIENGIPVVKSGTAELVYQWFYNGTAITDATNPTLTLNPVQLTSAGSYNCTITNDVGVTTTPAILLEVFDPNYTQSEIFNKNLVQNALGIAGADNWTAAVGSVEARILASRGTEGGREQGQADFIKSYKAQNTLRTGYSVDMLVPNPTSIDFGAIKQKDTSAYFTYKPLTSGQANLITRGPLTYQAKGGTQTNVIYQEIDLTDAQDYIAGKVWGVDGVKAYFSCYIANSVSRFLPTKEVITKEQRSNQSSYYLQEPRLSVENSLIAGAPAVDESLRVYVQEYQGAQLVQSSILDTSKMNVVKTYAPTLVDPITSALNKVRENRLAEQPLFTKDGLFSIPANSQYNEILNAYKLLYPSEQEHYAYGQVVTYNEIVFDRLNPLTNKIRITLLSELNGTRNLEDAPDYVSQGTMLEHVSWEKTLGRGDFKEGDYIIAEFGKLPEYKDKTPTQCLLDGSVPKSGATGFMLALHPITPNNALTTSTPTYYTNVRKFNFTPPIHTKETNVLMPDVPYVKKLVPSIEDLKTFKLSLVVDRDPSKKPVPTWAPAVDADTPDLDYTTTWTAEIRTYKKDIITGEYTKAGFFDSTGAYDKAETANEGNFNFYAFSSANTIQNGLTPIEGYVFGSQDVAIPQIASNTPTEKMDFSNYPPTTLIKPSNFSNSGPRLSEWANVDTRNYWRWAVKTPRKRQQTHHKTFKVVFDMYHVNSDESIQRVGSSTKYLVANKKVNLYFKDFFTTSDISQKEFISKSYTQDRRVFIVVKSYTQAHRFPIREWEDRWNDEGYYEAPPQGVVDGGQELDKALFETARSEMPQTGLVDFLLHTDPAIRSVLIYEYEIVHNKTKATI